jgi:hypothetical protein
MKKLNSSVYLFVFLTSVIMACQTAADKTEGLKNDTPEVVVKKAEAALTGNWISTDDAKSEISINADDWIEMYDGKQVSSSKYAMADTCLNAATDKSNVEGKYATVFDTSGNFCYYIVELTADNLKLSYVGRGNTLSYKRK